MSSWDLGVDLEQIGRFRDISKNQRFIRRYFTPSEISYCNSKGDSATHFAGIFAAKEAVFKALIKHLEVESKSFEILHDESGAPYLNWLRSEPSMNRSLQVKVSIAHSRTHAIAIAIARVGDFPSLPDPSTLLPRRRRLSQSLEPHTPSLRNRLPAALSNDNLYSA